MIYINITFTLPNNHLASVARSIGPESLLVGTAIDTLTYATGIGVRPCTGVTVYVNCSGFKMDAISGYMNRTLTTLKPCSLLLG